VSVNKALQDHKAMTVRREKTGHKDSMDLRVSARLGFKAMTDLKVLLGLLEWGLRDQRNKGHKAIVAFRAVSVLRDFKAILDIKALQKLDLKVYQVRRDWLLFPGHRLVLRVSHLELSQLYLVAQ